MFLTEDDYRVVCDEDELDILTRSEPETRQKAERVAMEEVASYLRPRYDTEKAFAAEGDQRNAMLVQVTVNIALYYLVHWLPQNLALDGRQELYDNAIAWLTHAFSVFRPDYEESEDTIMAMHNYFEKYK